MRSKPSGIRELQVARGIITVRWVTIPIVFAAALLSKSHLGMVFQIEPIYAICCLLACLNVFFSVHFSLLSRQLSMTHGIAGLKKLLMIIVSSSFSDLKYHGLRKLYKFPGAGLKLITIIYLIFLEAIKDMSFNPLGLRNVVHTQVLGDLTIIIALARFTGTTESPILFMTAVPITIVSAMNGFKWGFAYSFLAVFSWLALSFMIRHQVITHIKFYSPAYGDLSQSTGWIASKSFISFSGLIMTSFFANKLTSLFKERIYYLNSNLYKARSKANMTDLIASQISDAWIVTDIKGTIEKVKSDDNKFFQSQLIGKNLFTQFPEFEKNGLAYIMQAAVTGSRRRNVENIKIRSDQKTEHIFDVAINSFKDAKNQTRILLLLIDKTEINYLRSQTKQLNSSVIQTKTSFEQKALENAEVKSLYEDTSRQLQEKLVEVNLLKQNIEELKKDRRLSEKEKKEDQDRLASLKAQKDDLLSEMEYKQMLLENVSEAGELCNEIDLLIKLIEDRTKTLFNFDNTCLHIFKAQNSDNRITEVLDARKISPRLLEIPRKSPETLNPVIDNGRPVIINAQIAHEESTTLSVKDKQTNRLVAYIPVRHDGKVLGMMMLEKYGQIDNSDIMIEMLSNYLQYSASVIKSAIANDKTRKINDSLNKKLQRFFVQLDSIKTMVLCRPVDETRAFNTMLRKLSNVSDITDALFTRVHRDGSYEMIARIDKSKHFDLNSTESKILSTLKLNLLHKVSLNVKEHSQICTAYPLSHGNELLGVVYTYQEVKNPIEVDSDTSVMDFCISILRDQLALYVLSEEKEVWQSFYKQNLLA